MHCSYALCSPLSRQGLVSSNPAHREQRQSQVAHLHQRTMQCSLIDIGPAEDGLTLLDIGDGKAVKPFVPLLAEMSLDTNEIRILCHARIFLFMNLVESHASP